MAVVLFACAEKPKEMAANTKVAEDEEMVMNSWPNLQSALVTVAQKHTEIRRRIKFLTEQKEDPAAIEEIKEYLYTVVPRLNRLTPVLQAYANGKKEEYFSPQHQMKVESEGANKAFEDSIMHLDMEFDSIMAMTDVVLLARIDRINEAKAKYEKGK